MINEQLKKAIIESGISHRQLSIATGVERRIIGRFIEGKRCSNIGINTASILAEYLGLELRPKAKR